MRRQRKLWFMVVAILILAATGVRADVFFENFDSYPPGTQMHGVNGWKGWDNNPAWGALTTNSYSFSPDNSVAITANSDLVHEFGVVGGKYRFTSMQYIPSAGNGSSYFILLNEYADGGPYDWSVEVQFNMNAGAVLSDIPGGSSPLPIKYNQWVELRFDIDLDANTVDEYYDGQLLASHNWDNVPITDAIAAVDLFGGGASTVYYDDIRLTEIPEPASWTMMLLGIGLGALVLSYRRRK